MALRKIAHVFFIFLTVSSCNDNEISEKINSQSVIPFNPDSLLRQWVRSWNTYDLNQVDSLFLSNDTVTYFSSEKEGLIRGISAVRKHHESFGFVPGGKKTENKLWVNDVVNTPLENSGVVSGIWFFQKGNDTASVQRGPFTAVYVFSGKQYKIAHMHFASYPAKP